MYLFHFQHNIAHYCRLAVLVQMFHLRLISEESPWTEDFGFDNELFVFVYRDGYEVAVVYFRAGYDPDNYRSEVVCKNVNFFSFSCD